MAANTVAMASLKGERPARTSSVEKPGQNGSGQWSLMLDITRQVALSSGF